MRNESSVGIRHAANPLFLEKQMPISDEQLDAIIAAYEVRFTSVRENRETVLALAKELKAARVLSRAAWKGLVSPKAEPAYEK